MRRGEPELHLPLHRDLRLLAEMRLLTTDDPPRLVFADAGFEAANAGLVHEKYLCAWNSGYRDRFGEVERLLFLHMVARLASTKPVRDLLTEYHNRRRTMAEKQRGRQWQRQSLWRLVAGMGRSNPLEIGFNWDHRLGVPRLPGSSIKGAVLSWARACLDQPDQAALQRLFGKQEQAGSIAVLDAYPMSAGKLDLDVMNVHYKSYYDSQGVQPPTGMEGPTPLFFLAVPAGTEWVTWILPRVAGAGEDVAMALKWLDRCAAEWGLGAKTNVGYGYFADGSAATGSAGGGAVGISTGSGGGGTVRIPEEKLHIQTYRPGKRHLLPELVEWLEQAPADEERRALAAELAKKVAQHDPRPQEKVLLDRIRALAES